MDNLKSIFNNIPRLSLLDYDKYIEDVKTYTEYYIMDCINKENFNACFSINSPRSKLEIRFTPVAALQLNFLQEFKSKPSQFKSFMTNKELLKDTVEIIKATLGNLESIIKQLKKGDFEVPGKEILSNWKFQGRPSISAELSKCNRLVFNPNVGYNIIFIEHILGHYRDNPKIALKKNPQDINFKVQVELSRIYGSIYDTYDVDEVQLKLNNKYN